MDFDVIIIGGGAAGLSTALWCDELGLKTLLLESNAELGGQLLWTYNEIKNHLGIEATSGREMRDVFVKQAEKRGFAISLETKVREVDFGKKSITLENGETLFARGIIIATGIKRRKLGAEGEENFQNKGIIQTGKSERNAVENKAGAIVGGGDAAFENALILSETAAKIYLVTRGNHFRARRDFVERVLENGKIEILTETILTKFVGEERLEAVELKNLQSGDTKLLSAQFVLIRAGVAPNTEIFRGKIDLDEQGYIKIDSRCETSVKGVFAVGDAANPTSPTVSSAVGMGATAAKTIYQQLKN